MGLTKPIFSLVLFFLLFLLPLNLSAADFGLFTEEMPGLKYAEKLIGQVLRSPVKGQVKSRESRDGLTNLEILCQESYYLEGKLKSIKYLVWIVGIQNCTAGDEVKEGENLGLVTAQSKLTSVFPSLEDFPVRLTQSYPKKNKDFYFFTPNWLVATSTNFLSFRQVDSFESAVLEFFKRWQKESEEGQPATSTIHYYPEYDRIRAKIKLDSYPVEAQRIPALNLTELTFYKPGLFVFENSLTSSAPYQPILYWQKGFLEYLQKEYTLGQEIYIYCSLYALDHANKKVIVCVRDFSLETDEEKIKQRLADFK